jgi:beta-N-acetylhexosaminidase
MKTPPARTLCSLVAAVALAAGCSATGGPSARPASDQPRSDRSTTRTPGAGAGSTTPLRSPRPTPGAAAERSRAVAPAGPGWGPTRAQMRQARAAVGRMSLREKAGQVIVARYNGTGSPTALVRRYHLGGVIVMGDNIASVAAVRRSNARLQRSDDRRWPLFIGVDQEGGIVNRLNAPMTPFPTMMTHGASGRSDLARAAAQASGEELRAAGFTVVFAPDADVTTGAGDPTIGSRSVGSRPQQVARIVTAAVEGYRDAGIVPVVKHFPGHGSVGTDSHLDLPVQDASMRTLRRRDLVPFRAAIGAGAPATMIAHLDVRAVDRGTPSTLSRPVVTGLLRNRMGFGGLVVTDALEMGAIVDRYGTGTAAVESLRAGVDVLLMPADLPGAHRAIVRAVRAGRLPQARLDEAAARVVAVLMHQAAAGTQPRPRAIGSHAGVSYRASQAAVTVVSGPCRGRLVRGGVAVSGDPDAVAAFRAAARRRGLSTSGGTSVALLGYGASARRADVVVATDTPYVLGQSRARSKIATFGDTPGAMRALVDVLVGRARAPGRLPVRVGGVSRPGC